MKRVFLVNVAIAAALAMLAAPATAATLTPNISAEDNGTADCSLREAISQATANSDGGGCDTETTGPYGDAITDEIVLTSPNPYTLTTPTTNEDLNFDGDLDVGGGGPIVIRSDAPGVRRQISMGGLVDRMIDLRNLNGPADLTLRDIDLGTAGEIPAENGGVILAETNGNDLDLENVEIVHNDDVNAVDGGLIYVSGASSTFEMSDSRLEGGDATSDGGGLYLDIVAPVTIERSLISSNDVVAPNGSNAGGGGIFSTAPMTIVDSEISDNTATAPGAGEGNARGGGVSTLGALTMRRTLVEGNEAFGNDAGTSDEHGGGIWMIGLDGDSLIQNSTITENSAGNDVDHGAGGGLYNASIQLVQVVHTTFLANNASVEANGDHIHNAGTGLIYASSVIPGGGGVNPCEGGDATTVSGGYNALSPDDADGCDAEGTGDATGVVGIVPGGATANGGPAIGGSDPVPTRTIAISAGGIADNHVPTANCGPAGGVDARGITRPQGSACDAGAFEIVVPAPPATPTPPAADKPKAKKCKKKKKKKGKGKASPAAKKKCKKKKKKRK
jgi:hypothetical protein